MINHFDLWFEQSIVVLDFETTGYEPTRGDKIVEAAAVRLERMKIVNEWHTFLNPERQIPDEASRIHGIYDEDVALAPVFKQKAPEFIKFCEGAVPCAYNEGFDRGFAMAEFWNAGISLDMPLMSWPCWLNPLSWVRSIDRFVTTEDGSKTSNDLASACARRGITLSGAHGALADTRCLAMLLASLVGDMPRCTISELLRRQPLLGMAYERRRKAAKAAGRIE